MEECDGKGQPLAQRIKDSFINEKIYTAAYDAIVGKTGKSPQIIA